MLEDLAKKHNIWIAMGLNMGIPHSDIEDVVQEMYIRLNKYITDKSKIYYKDTGEINRFYVWVTLRNMWISIEQANKRNVLSYNYDIDNADTYYNESLVDEAYDKEYKEALDAVIRKVDEEVDTWDYWYDQKLWNVIFKNDISMRQLSRDTTISLTSIFNSMKKYKEKVRDAIDEDWQDFININWDKL